MANDEYRYRITILGRYPARMKGNEPAVTFNVLAGRPNHLTYAGTLTMTDDEWKTFSEALRKTLGDAIEVEDHTLHH
jgi:hypothetical protein